MMQTTDFLTVLEGYYRRAGRDLPWRQLDGRGTIDPYRVLVSELMLQQTQVNRVLPKYTEFLRTFPTLQSLAEASQPEVLALWSGLGYNRRALYLHQAAKQLAKVPEPWRFEDLVVCKGIGPNTAGAILAYSYNEPVLFLETNVKTVLIHHFFEDKTGISDNELLGKLAEVAPWLHPSLPTLQPRLFYWALMDYGTHLKATIGNQSHRSKSFTRQSKFEGSLRQIRGRVIKLLLSGPQPLETVRQQIADDRLDDVVAKLQAENMVKLTRNTLMLYNETNKS